MNAMGRIFYQTTILSIHRIVLGFLISVCFILWSLTYRKTLENEKFQAFIRHALKERADRIMNKREL